MWWRFITFCILVCIVLFVVLSCIHGQPVTHLFFHRCCEDNIENDQVIFENFANNFLRERLISDDNLLVNENDSFVTSEEVEELLALMKTKLNVHDPRSRVDLTELENAEKSKTKTDLETNIEQDSDNFVDSESTNNELTKTDSESEDSYQIDTNDETEALEGRQSFKGDERDEKNKEISNLFTTIVSSTTETISIKDVMKSSEELEVTTDDEWDSLKDVILSELDSDESGEGTTKRQESELEFKLKDLGIIK